MPKRLNLGEVAELTERLGVSLHLFTAEHVMEAKLAYARCSDRMRLAIGEHFVDDASGLLCF